MSPVHPQGSRRPNFGQPVTRPTPGRTERNGTVVEFRIMPYRRVWTLILDRMLYYNLIIAATRYKFAL